MRNQRRNLLALSAAVAALIALAPLASAQTPPYPTKPLRIVVGFAAGGGQDQIARMLGQGLSDRLGQQVLIDNRPGATGQIGSVFVARAKPDGYTLLFANSASHGVSPATGKPIGYDP